MIPMDSVARTDSEFFQLEKFVIKATVSTQPKEFPELVYSDRPPAPITSESYTVNFMGSNAQRDLTIEQNVRVHEVNAAARYKISDLLRAQDTDCIIQALKELVDTQKLSKIRLHGEAKRVVKRYFADNKDELEVNERGVLIKKRKLEKKFLYEHNAIIAPPLLQCEILFRMHELNHRQGINKTIDKIDLRFD